MTGTWVVLGLAGLWGALWGSFFNVAIFRFPWKDESVVTPPSHCTSCNERIAWYDNLPIVSYLFLRGSCRHCGVRLSPQYVLVELLSALFCVALMWRLGPTAATFTAGTAVWMWVIAKPMLYFAVGGFLIVAGIIDLRTQLLPDGVTLPAAVVAALTSWYVGVPGLLDSMLGAAVGAGIVLLFHYGWKLLRGFEGMGLGDSKLMLAIGAWLGLPGVLFAFFAGAIQGIVAWLFFRGRLEEESSEEERQRRPTQVPIPFGPFLVLAALEFAVFGDWVMAWVDYFLSTPPAG